MGRPKALKDSMPARELRGSAEKKSHVKFSEDTDDVSDEEDTYDNVPVNAAADDDESDDDAPEEISKEESIALFKLKEMHEQTILLDSKARKLKKKQEAKALAGKRKAESSVDADEELDMSLLEEISTKKVRHDQEVEEEARLREEDEEEEDEGFDYGSFNARKVGKITIKVLPPSGGSKFEDEPDESLSILDNYKASSAAVDFMNQMRAGQDRIKLSTKKSQKHKAHRKRR